MYADELAQSYAAIRGRLMGMPRVVAVKAAQIPPPSVTGSYQEIQMGMGGKWQVEAHNAIIREVSAKHDVPKYEIMGHRRQPWIIAARFECYYRMRHELGYSLPMIGKACGGKEHAGVKHGIRKHLDRIELPPTE